MATTGTKSLGAQEVEAFAGKMRGRIIQPGDDGYAKACALWNGTVVRRPALIVQPRGPADVMAAVTFARSQQLPLSVRGGGHNVAGHALCDGGLAIDLSGMRAVRVDPVRRRAHVEGGATLGDVDHEAQAHALATPFGVVSRTGVGGLTLHGGLGFLTRKFGLTCDLLWALRGGGGNFGDVMSGAGHVSGLSL